MFKDKFLTKAIEAYNGKHVLNRILKHGVEALKLGGQVKDMTIYFQKIVDITDITDRLSPEDLVHFIKEYLSIMTTTIESYEGIVDRYIGIDGIMAFWGANDEADHADKACTCAAEVIERGRLLSERWNHKGVQSLRVSIGVNSGRVILGNFGTPSRFQYTIFGDNVNLASRLEGANEHYGTAILLSEYTKEKLNDQKKVTEVDSIHVRGKSDPVRLYTLEA
jgi:adenylate cyclase